MEVLDDILRSDSLYNHASIEPGDRTGHNHPPSGFSSWARSLPWHNHQSSRLKGRVPGHSLPPLTPPREKIPTPPINPALPAPLTRETPTQRILRREAVRQTSPPPPRRAPHPPWLRRHLLCLLPSDQIRSRRGPPPDEPHVSGAHLRTGLYLGRHGRGQYVLEG